MLSISSIKGDAGYYSHEDNYYASGSLDSRWMGEGAEKLGLKGEVASADMDAVRQGKLPDGSDLSRMVNGVNKHRSGYDLTFSAPKSVSVMALVGEDRRFIEAHNRAVAVVMQEVEKLVSARITEEGKTETVLTGNMVAALYNHDTSRDLDPQLHTHALVFNATFAGEKWRSLASDTRMKTGFSENLYATKIALGNLYRSALREDVESMGFETVAAGKNGLWELKDVPVDVFSSRSQTIREAAGPDASAKSRDVAALDTRQAKAWADPELLKADWRRRLADEKFDIDGYIRQAQARVEVPGAVAGGHSGIHAPDLSGGASSGEIADEQVRKAVSDTISALSEKKVQFTWSEMLAGTVNRLPSAPGLFEQARAGIDAAIEGQRLIPLDREKGIFTSDIHLLNELSVHQLARTAIQEQTVLLFPERAQERDIPAGDAVSVLTQDKSPVAILSGRGGAQALRERTEDVAMMARSQGREVMVIAADGRSGQFMSESPHLAGHVMLRSQMNADTVLPVQGTVIVDRAERLSLKETVLLQEKALSAGAQLIFMDTENRQGTGNALSVLKEAGIPQYRFYSTQLPEVRLVSEADKRSRYSQLAQDYVRLSAEGRDVVAQVTGAREQQQLTDIIRESRREAGELGREQMTLQVLEPVWLDSKTRHQRDNYRAGMVMEHWDAEKKTMTRHTIDRVAEATNSLVLQGEDGSRLTLKVSQLDGSWSLYRSRTLAVSEGDRVRALGRELKGAIKAKEQFTVTALENGAIRLRSGDRELRLPTERAVKLAHDYVEGTGAGTSASRTVLAAVGPRSLNKQVLNALAQSGGDIRIYTPLEAGQAARKVENVSSVRLASDQVRQSTGETNLDTAIQASRERLMSDAEQAVNLAIPRAQQGQVYLSEIALLSEAVKSGQPLADVRTAIARQVNSGELIQLDSVSGVGNRVLVPRVAYEMEKSIIRHIAEGKDAVQPLMALTPASVLAGLTAGQREATRTVLENTDRFMAIQGYAGVGKTTQFRAVMGALNTLSESVRPQVIGLGPTHRAVHEMREAGVEARTLASFLSETRQAIQAGETPDFRNVLFLTDESSMVGNRDMAELYQLVAAGGGRMVSSGDTAQLQAVSTGQPFRLVQQRSAIDTVVMQEIVRQTPALRPAIESIIAGQVETSLRQVGDVSPLQVPRQEGAWVPEKSVMEIRAPKKGQEQDTPAAGEQTLTPEQLSLVRTDIIEAIRDDWMGRTPEAQQQTLVVAELNADRHAINAAIHAARHEKGDTGAEERTFTVLEPLRVPDNALRAAETFAEYTGAVAMMNERYWTVAEVNTQDAVVTLRNADGESVLLSPQQNTAQDISLFTPRELTVSQGDRVRFTRSDTDRGYVANSLWEVAGFTDDGAIRFRQGEQEKIVDPQAMTEDRHIDLAYALTVYGVQGASERFAIALTGTEGGRKRMASLESTYVTLSRAKEHVQVYTDNLEDWQQQVRQSDGGKTAHDLLHEKSDRESDTGNRLLATASRLDKTALGRRVLAENGLEGETMARFIAAGKKYPAPYVALPVWNRHGKEAGALLTEIRIEDDGMRVVLSEESRLRAGEDAQFAGLQASRNGQTLIADDAQTALRLAQENPESGVVIRLHGEERLLNAARLTGGRITEPDEVARTVRSVAEAESVAKAEDPITLPPDEQQKLAEAQEKAARELAEQARRELLSVAPQKDEGKRDPLLSADDERRLRDNSEREIRELDEAVREAVADGRGARQQAREQILRTEREWVVNMPEKEIEMEKTLGGD
ncbi:MULTISPECIES: conjugative transfer relaxase/helicase TraI [Enterobacteriaceae]|uniref:IncF plasmid conjugative transfer DNA-nicking and unwinding protein TraI n=4 Tax=Enterobacteriaceae TaxID=543 RepID=A0A142CLT6_SHIDY|nr:MULTISPECIES: conjugative transfer relaxase/helicase TraI [Enterobacteriaceae]EFV9735762.1 conjugative transfer relaxase/helicase TraI [Shigella flexneri]EHD3466409.1 conjugative transfer relaxase/helicase TraI [Escherichia coli O124]EKG0288242.1 conjugative transfer relaxase/helicase TraI [Escherichia albertii]AMQ11531.1 IncF plasmid conjugative transfer DNA-nicking and unwinding protein TraI [Shigella dysenteriae 1]ASF37518.1 conjugative transfer relaxase protein TraI [Escherichia coli B1